MASNIKFKRSAVQNRVPTTAQLELGELALNTYDGKLYTEINTGSAAVVEIGSKLSSLVVDGANGGGGGDVVFHGTTAGRDLTWDYSNNSLVFADNAIAYYGSDNDLNMYHTGSTGYIKNTTGTLYIQDDSSVIIGKVTGSHTGMKFIGGGALELYHNNNLRLATTADGADISGTGSLKLPVGTTAQRSGSPTAGDLRYNSTLGAFEGYSSGWGELGGSGIGIGSTSVNPGSGVVGDLVGVGYTTINFVGAGLSVTGYGTTIVVDLGNAVSRKYGRSIHSYTATANQTTFTGMSYTDGAAQISVYLNGAKLSAATYTATSGNTVVLATGASVGDEVEIICIDSGVDITRTVHSYTATAGQTAFTGLGYEQGGNLDVYLNGIRLAQSDYTANNGTSLTLAAGASVGDLLEVVDMGPGAQWESGFGEDNDDIFRFNGGVGIGTTNPTDKLNIVGNVEILGILTATTFSGVDTDKIEEGNSSVEVIDSGSNGKVALTVDGAEKYRFTDGSLNFASGSVIRMTGIAGGTGGGLHLDGAGNNGRIAVFGNSGTLSLLHSTASSDTNMAVFNKGGSVDLYHNGNKKFETAAYGVNVTGTIDTDGIIVSAASTFANVTAPGGSESRMYAYTEGGATTGTLVLEGKQDVRFKTGGFHRWILDGGDLVTHGTTYHNLGSSSASGGRVGNGNFQTSVDLIDNGELRLGTGDDLKLLHNGSDSIINNTTGSLLIQDGGTTKITVTSATTTVANNLTVSGNLQIDGTTTTVNTATMTVEDKNIEIAKGAANDAAADGAGITVDSGDGDKTWNWVDATDAWTSSEHIHLGDDKQLLLGTSSDFKIYHSNALGNVIAAPQGHTTKFYGPQVEMYSLDGTKKSFVSDADASVELYENNSKKLETTGSGVTVTGTCTATTFSGSGASLTNVDATTLDSIDSASFLRSDATDTCEGRIQFRANAENDWDDIATSTGSRGCFEIYNSASGNDAFIALHTGSDFACYFGLNADTNDLAVGGWSMGANKYRIWHAGNDGTGSGLDADTLDGLQASQFLRSDTADTIAGNLTVGTGNASYITMVDGDNGNRQIHNNSNYIGFLDSSGNWAARCADSGQWDCRAGLNVESTTTTQDIKLDAGYHLQRSDHHSGHLEGSYNNVGANTAKSNPIYTIGSSYNPADATLGNMYGIGYTKGSNASFLSLTGQADAWGMYVAANGSARIFLDGTNGHINAAGHLYCDRVYTDLQTTRYLSDVSGDYGSLQINGGGSGNWQGYSIQGRAVFMHDGGTATGIYNDVNNHWLFYAEHGGNSQMRCNNTERITATSSGATISGALTVNGDCSIDGNTTYAAGHYIKRADNKSGFFTGLHGDGSNNDTHSCPIYTIGPNYNPALTTLGNMYGIGFSHGNASFTPSGASWGLYVASDGNSRIFLDAANSRVYIGTSNRYIGEVTGDYGTFQCNAGGTGGYQGFSIDGRAVFMHDGGSVVGIYNDVNNEWLLRCDLNGASAMYHDGAAKVTTDGSGAVISGRVYSDSGTSTINNLNFVLNSQHTQQGRFTTATSGQTATNASALAGSPGTLSYAYGYQEANSTSNGGWSSPFPNLVFGYHTGVQIGGHTSYGGTRFYNDHPSRTSTKLFTIGDGDNNVRSHGNLFPAVNNSIDLGSNALRWRVIYTNDLELSNKGSQNKVDGTWGDWTLQEGEDNIYMINNRSGKKFKINMTEVS